MKKLSKMVFFLLVVALVVSLMACLLLFIEIRKLDWGLAATTEAVVTSEIKPNLKSVALQYARDRLEYDEPTTNILETTTETKHIVTTPEPTTKVKDVTITEIQTEVEITKVITTEAEPEVMTMTEVQEEPDYYESEEDYDSYELALLTRLIYWESRDQSSDCQRAVGTVALNRLERGWNGAYSLESVIFADWQYSCTWEEDFWSNKLDWKLYKKCKENAEWLLSGGRYFGTEYVYQAQFEQGYDTFWIGSECFGKG